jgi:hypothetical protein
MTIESRLKDFQEIAAAELHPSGSLRLLLGDSGRVTETDVAHWAGDISAYPIDRWESFLAAVLDKVFQHVETVAAAGKADELLLAWSRFGDRPTEAWLFYSRPGRGQAWCASYAKGGKLRPWKARQAPELAQRATKAWLDAVAKSKAN